jgi:SagB-type dehydrogenase family enzyme
VANAARKAELPSREIKLPEPRLDGTVSIEIVLCDRRSVRDFSNAALELSQVAQLVWAAQGVTCAAGHRAAPSAGGLYALDLHIIAANVHGLPAGVYKYEQLTHELVSLTEGDLRGQLAHAALEQPAIPQAAAIFLVSAVYARISDKYGERGIRYAHMEAGHAAQNLLLQAVALGLGAVLVGAFDDAAVRRVLRLGNADVPLYLIPVGHP